MSELEEQVHAYLDELRRENASEHTIRNYASDLRQFHAYLTPPDGSPPAPDEIDTLLIREWLGDLYRRQLSPVTLRRKMAAVRSFCQFLVRTGRLEVNRAKLVGTPKSPKTLPRVPTAEQTNSLLDRVSEADLKRAQPSRDVAIFELLYGCGLRVGELVELQLGAHDNDRATGVVHPLS